MAKSTKVRIVYDASAKETLLNDACTQALHSKISYGMYLSISVVIQSWYLVTFKGRNAGESQREWAWRPQDSIGEVTKIRN